MNAKEIKNEIDGMIEKMFMEQEDFIVNHSDDCRTYRIKITMGIKCGYCANATVTLRMGDIIPFLNTLKFGKLKYMHMSMWCGDELIYLGERGFN